MERRDGGRPLTWWIPRLRERDGDDCQLCHQLIDFSLNPGTDPWAASRDHIKPRAAGGGDTLINSRLAHSICNGRRGSVWNGRDYSRVARPVYPAWDEWAAAHHPAGGQVIYPGDEPVLPCF